MSNQKDLDNFRINTREWLIENCPDSMRKSSDSDEDKCWGGKKWKFTSQDQKLWFERMSDKGWTVPDWPKEYGGGGLTSEEHIILQEELLNINAKPPLESFGIWMLGPALLKYGTEKQKLKHLPDIAKGRIRWAQGYSEPNSGSDLASVMTKCEDKGDFYEINGQKVWTSYADEADWIFALVRTNTDGPKHKGISFILIDMDQPGVSTKPIKLISGKSPFCETFFENARAEKNNLIGELNAGWEIAKYLLTHEREMIGGWGIEMSKPINGIAIKNFGLDKNKKLSDPILRTDIARTEIDGIAFGAKMEDVQESSKSGQSIGSLSSMLKYYGTELNKKRLELLIDSYGYEGLDWDSEDDVARKWLRTKANSIEGGTSEIQLNIISKQILNLPNN
ncbi:MAG: acyl-CoA dehydrogenase family protein [Pseudomonadota bacterium]|nr:acyl-CoA dehydrogenase family protein [Pseudomonadota bacterium]